MKVLAAELDGEAMLVLGESAIRVKPVSRGHVSLIAAPAQFGGIIGNSASMQRLFSVLERIAAVPDAERIRRGPRGAAHRELLGDAGGARPRDPSQKRDCVHSALVA